jgi:hypothetical protein
LTLALHPIVDPKPVRLGAIRYSIEVVTKRDVAELEASEVFSTEDLGCDSRHAELPDAVT